MTTSKPPARASSASEPPRRGGDLARHLDHLLLSRYAPPGVLVNEKMEILQFRGLTGPYLQPAPGGPRSNLVKMARPGLLATLRDTIARAKKQMAPVRSEGVEVDDDGRARRCDVVVLPIAGLSEPAETLFMVVFEERRSGRKPARASPRAEARRIARLEHELAATRDYLCSLLDEPRTDGDLASEHHEPEAARAERPGLTTANDELNRRIQELARVNGELMNVLRAVDVPIVIVDAERRIRRYTPSARSILNVLPTDVGRPLAEIEVHIAVRDLDRQIAAVIETMTMKEMEAQDQAGHWYRMRIRPYFTADKRIDGAIVSLVDIDELKHHVSDAHAARVEAERANLTKDQFLATLSHELRSPLASMLINAQTLRSGGMDEAALRRTCDAIERGTKMQMQIIEDLLDVSRIIAGKLHLDRRPVELVEVIQAALDGVRPLAERKTIQIVKTVPDQPIGPVYGDPVRLQQIVSNLLTNAIKFSSPGGRVTVTVRSVGGDARIEVSDAGVGIEPKFLPRIFNRFAQEDSSSTRAYGGLGLGLAIVRHLVELHGGSVQAESAGKGQGATLTVNLPLMRDVERDARAGSEPPSGPHRPVAAADARLRDLAVLVVDDNPETRDAVGHILRQRGAGVTLAASAAEAMAAVERSKPEVIVCDLAMPGEDGYSFIRRLRSLEPAAGGGVPALALTALAGEEDRRRALACGFQLFLTKPVDTDRLVETIAALRARGPAPASA